MPLEALIVGVVVERLSRPDAVDLLTAHDDEDLSELRSEADRLRSRLETIAIEFADGHLTGAQLRAGTGRVQSRLQAVEARLAEAGRSSAVGPFLGAEDVQATWDALPVERQRSVIDTLITVVIERARPTRVFRLSP